MSVAEAAIGAIITRFYRQRARQSVGSISSISYIEISAGLGKCRRQVPRRIGSASLGFANTWEIILEQLGHGLLESALVLIGIFAHIECFARQAAPHELSCSWVEEPDCERPDFYRRSCHPRISPVPEPRRTTPTETVELFLV